MKTKLICTSCGNECDKVEYKEIEPCEYWGNTTPYTNHVSASECCDEPYEEEPFPDDYDDLPEELAKWVATEMFEDDDCLAINADTVVSKLLELAK